MLLKLFDHIQIFTNTHPRWTEAKPRGTSAAASRAGASPAASLADPSRLPRYNNIQPSTKNLFFTHTLSVFLFTDYVTHYFEFFFLNLTDDVLTFLILFFMLRGKGCVRIHPECIIHWPLVITFTILCVTWCSLYRLTLSLLLKHIL